MKVLAVILLVACIADIVQAVRIFEKGRKDYGIRIFDMSYLRNFKAAGYQVIMNTAAAIFFIVYLLK